MILQDSLCIMYKHTNSTLASWQENTARPANNLTLLSKQSERARILVVSHYLYLAQVLLLPLEV